jgi:type 1 glutamine amidotransferase
MAQPEANEFIGTGKASQYNIIIFYDMWGKISEDQQKGYLSLTEKGTPLLFLHHSIVSYQDWDEFRKILGGKYIQPAIVTDSSLLSHYKHDILLNVHIIDPENPITKGLKDFEITDEGYSNFAVEPDVNPILSTKNPDSGEIIGWTKKYRNSKIVYIMLGHDKKAYANENFQTLVKNSIEYLISKQQDNRQ